MIYLLKFFYTMLLLILRILSKLLVILVAFNCLFIIYPLGVLLPFMWNFRWNPKGWVFDEGSCDETAIIVILRGKDDDDKWYFYDEKYPTAFHLLLAAFLNDYKSYTSKHYNEFKLLKDNNSKIIGATMKDDKGGLVIDLETTGLEEEKK